MTDNEKIQMLRDIEDNRYIDMFDDTEEEDAEDEECY